MSSNSVDEDEPNVFQLFDENNENYMEACDDEVNEVVPRFERLCINDNETMHLSSDNMNMPGFINSVPSSINNFDEAPTVDSNENSIFFEDSYSKIYINEAAKAEVANKTSLSESVNTQVDTQSQEDIQKTSAGRKTGTIDAKEEHMLDKPKEKGAECVCKERLPDLSPERTLSYHNDAKSNPTVSEIKTENQSLMLVPEKMVQVASGNSEAAENLSIVTPGSTGYNFRGKDQGQSSDEMSNGGTFDTDSSKLSYSADISSDDQTQSSGIVIDSSPDASYVGAMNAAAAEDKRSTKLANSCSPPVSGIGKNRHRRFGTVQSPSSTIGFSRKNSSDEDPGNSSIIRKDSPINSRRKCKKTVKSPPGHAALNLPDAKQEEKKPSPYKRKKTSSDAMTDQPTGKFRKRSISEHYAKTGEKTHLEIRSRSLSPGSINTLSTSFTNLPVEKLTIAKSRKRTFSNA